jgi:hypothetical protein
MPEPVGPYCEEWEQMCDAALIKPGAPDIGCTMAANHRSEEHYNHQRKVVWTDGDEPDPDWIVDLTRAQHPFAADLQGTWCSMCGDPATHKVGEQIDLPCHELTNYLCCLHFKTAVGDCESYPYEQFVGEATEVDYSAAWRGQPEVDDSREGRDD